MKKINIKRATIFGFGKWVDYTVTFSTDTLNCIYGFNESGKSTLQQFILFMLFGFPPKKRQFYRPKTSGKMGGRLTITDEIYGTYTIERLDEVKNGVAICYLQDGRTKDETWLQERLRGMRAPSYEAVYLFSALELHHIKTMKHTDIGDVLLGIGLTSAHNIYEIEKQLDQEIGKLFKPFGTNPLINQQLNALEQTHEALVKSQQQQATYQETHASVTEMEKDMQHLQFTLKNKKNANGQVKKQLDHYTLIMEYHQLLNKQIDHPNFLPFPENGIERLEKVNDQLLPFKSEYTVLTANWEKNNQKYTQFKNEQFEHEMLQELHAISAQMEKYHDNKKTHQNLVKARNQLEITLNTETSHLNIKLERETLSNITLPFYTERNWQDIEKETTQIVYEREQLEQLDMENKRKKTALMDDVKSIKAQLLSDERQAALRQTIQTQEIMAFETKRRQQTENNHRQWIDQTNKKQKKRMIMLVSTLLLALLSGFLGWFLDELVLYIVMVGIGVVGCIQWLTERQTIHETTQWLSRVSDIKEPFPNVSEEEQAQATRLLRKHEQYVNDLTAAKTELKTCHIQQLQWTEKNKLINQRAGRLKQRAQAQIEAYPFLQDVEPTYWSELFHTLKRLITLQQEIKDISQQTMRISRECAVFEEQLRAVAIRVDSDLAEQPVTKQVEKLQSIMTEQHDMTQHILQIEQVNNELLETKKILQQKMTVYEQEKQRLFEAAHVENDNDFYGQWKSKQAQEETETALQHITNQLKTLLPPEIYEQVTISLPNESELISLHETYKQHIQANEQALEKKRQLLANAKAELNQLESSDSYSQLNHRFIQQKEQLQQSAKKWSVQKVAKEMLFEAKQTYQEKYLATALKKATNYFKHVTDNAYIAIYAPTAKKTFQVETYDHHRFNVHELSQGTIDQLYICFRLAIGEVMSQDHRLPFIIDDAFVHFDSHRMKRMIDILKQVSMNRQVILFTCKREIIENLSATDVHVLDNASRQLL